MSDYDNIHNIQSALNHIDPQDRDTWFRMGAAIKDELGEEGFDIWDNWSQQSSNYKAADAKAVWKSIQAGHIHIATLFKTARENGYRLEKPYTPPSPEILAQRAKATQEKQYAEAKRIAQAHAKAAKTAYGIWKNANPADPNHTYAQNKGLGLSKQVMSGIRQNEYQGKKQLIIPLYADKKLVNVQSIDEQGNKSFLSGGQKQGAYTVIGDFKQHQQGIILAEGFATAASVHQATGKPIVVAFDAGNLKAVSEKLLNVLPEDTPIYFAADNDPNQTGLNKAQAAAEIWGERAKIILPEFSQAQIEQFKQDYGAEKMPTDFNDLHQLAGIDAVRQSFNIAIEAEIKQTELSSADEIWRKAERSDWGEFSSLIRNGNLEEMKTTDGYREAKAGDPQAALNLVQSLLSVQTVDAIKKMANGREPIIVGIRAEESKGKNQIPNAMAKILAATTGWERDTSLYQVSYAGRTGSDSSYRLAFPAVFSGKVENGRDYLILDDNSTMGGTIAGLKGYIENRGGKVIGAAVMSARATGLELVPTEKQLNDIQRKHGDAANDFFQKTYGYGIQRLTRSEAGAVRTSPTIDELRNRINEARISASGQNHGRALETKSDQIESAQRNTIERIAGTTEPPINPSTQTATSNHDVAVFLSQEQTMTQQEKTTYSPDNPYAQWAEYDEEVRKNADDWEMRTPLTEARLNEFNQQAEKHGFTTYVESNHAGLGIFQADNWINDTYHVDIVGEFKNHSGKSVYENPHDFTMSFHQDKEVVHYVYTNNLNDALNQANEFLKNPEQWIKEQDSKIKEKVRQQMQSAHIKEEHTATSEKGVAVSSAEQEKTSNQNPPEIKQPKMLNSIEYDEGQLIQEKEQQQDNKQENPTEKPQRTPIIKEQDIQAAKLESRKAITNLSYTPPKALNDRYVIADTAKIRLLNQDIGTHSVKYLSPENAKTVLMEDKGKSIHTTRSDQQTIQDMLTVAQTKNWDSIKISGSKEFKQQMWLEAESRGIVTKGYKPSPEDLALLENRRIHLTTNHIAEAEKLKQESAIPMPNGTQNIPNEAIQTADKAKEQFHQKIGLLDSTQQLKAQAYEKIGMAILKRLPIETQEKFAKNFYENQADKIQDGKYNAPDPIREMPKQEPLAQEKANEPRRDDDWEVER